MEQPVSIGPQLQSVLGTDRPDSVVERLKSVSVGTIQNLQRAGFHGQFMAGVRPQNAHTSFAGRAMTLRTVPSREDVAKEVGKAVESLHRRAYESIGAGQVLVIDARGEMGGAVGGDILVSGIGQNLGVALVTDGAIRDLPAMQAVNLPVFARGDHPRTFGEVHVAMDLNIPVQCAGVLVMPGDIVVGDAEGVVVIRHRSQKRSAPRARSRSGSTTSFFRRWRKEFRSAMRSRQTSAFVPNTRPHASRRSKPNR